MTRSKLQGILVCSAVLVGALLLVSGCVTEEQPAAVIGKQPAINLTYYAEEDAPYTYRENGTLKGIAVDLLEAVTAKVGQRLTPEEIQVVPWSVAYQKGLTQNGTVIFVTARLPEREQSFKWVGPIIEDRNVLFARNDSGITIRSPDDLKEYRIGTVADDFGVQQLLDLGVNESQLVQATNVTTLIDKLQSGEIDLWSYRELGGRHHAEQQTGNYYIFRVVYAFDAVEGYYAFSRDIPDATVQSFQQALDALKTEKDAAGVTVYDRIVRRYIPPEESGMTP